MAEIASRFFGSRDRDRIHERRRAGGLQPPRTFVVREKGLRRMAFLPFASLRVFCGNGNSRRLQAAGTARKIPDHGKIMSQPPSVRLLP
jgi:hypothetical protein